MEVLLSLGSWNWFILGAVLLVLELLVPGTFLLWLGLAALAVGIISRFIVWSWQLQLVAFAVFAVALIPAWRYFARRADAPSDHPMLNRRTDAYVGRIFTLEKPIVDGSGVVRIDDTVWRVVGPDCPAGSRVRVTQADGADLRVEVV
ncbi:MAG: NfeD family protein [Rhizobiales bacterium]|nr:NfeD family protein [Hyphomicrobiales bacterium]